MGDILTSTGQLLPLNQGENTTVGTIVSYIKKLTIKQIIAGLTSAIAILGSITGFSFKQGYNLGTYEFKKKLGICEEDKAYTTKKFDRCKEDLNSQSTKEEQYLAEVKELKAQVKYYSDILDYMFKKQTYKEHPSKRTLELLEKAQEKAEPLLNK